MPQETETALAPVAKESKADHLLSVIASAAENPNVDADKMRALWELSKEIQTRESQMAFNAAMFAAQMEMKPIVKDTVNEGVPGGKTKYAKLEKIDRLIRPIYTKHGFIHSFGSKAMDNGTMCITCDLIHAAGFSKYYELAGAVDSSNKAKSPTMAVGSTTSFYQRYLTCLIWNIVLVGEDVDGAPPDAGRLSEEQLNNLRNLINACEMNEGSQKKFCEMLNAKSLEDIKQFAYDIAVTQLRAKLRTKEGR